MNLPNAITIVRIVLCPLIWVLVMSPDTTVRLVGWVVFLAAALSDLWDGHLARKYGWVTDMGKLLDPLADKLLLVVSLVPIYLIAQGPGDADQLAYWGELPLWAVLLIFGREIFVTLFRQYAQRRGVVIAAGSWGKRKALVQNLFAGGALLWFPLAQLALDRGWSDQAAWGVWSIFHGLWNAVTLALAVGLTTYSLADYLWRYRGLLRPTS
jgi:CDP-diacylglycerol--glycerol-3-phosphate 3-phosphatidyltransferase